MSTLKQKKEEFEKEEVQKAVDESPTQIDAAKKLGISRMSLYRKMLRYDLGTFHENKMQKPKDNK